MKDEAGRQPTEAGPSRQYQVVYHGESFSILLVSSKLPPLSHGPFTVPPLACPLDPHSERTA